MSQKKQASILNFFSKTATPKQTQPVTNRVIQTENVTNQHNEQKQTLKQDLNVAKREIDFEQEFTSNKMKKKIRLQSESDDESFEKPKQIVPNQIKKESHKRLKKIKKEESDEEYYIPKDDITDDDQFSADQESDLDENDSFIEDAQPVKPNKKIQQIQKKPKQSMPTNTTPRESLNTSVLTTQTTSQKSATINYNDFDDATPIWATKEECRDAQKRKSDDPLYDPSTLYIPPEDFKKLTPTMKQYWNLKKDNFDTVILFKLGKFYELFYDDAYIGNKYLDLNYMGKKMHAGFPEKSLDYHATKLVQYGFKVAVVEQTETPKEMEDRVMKAKNKGIKLEKTVDRAPVEIRTQGTYLNADDPHSRYLLCLKFQGLNQIGLSFYECGSYQITLGTIQDDEHWTKFKTLLSQIKPHEVLLDKETTPGEILKILKGGYSPPAVTHLGNKQNQWHAGSCLNMLEKQWIDEKNYPQALKQLAILNTDKDIILQALGGMFNYFTQILIFGKVIEIAQFNIYDPSKCMNSNMLLDSQALQHLEILEAQNFTKNIQDGSVLSFIDKTSSAFGKRLLRRWICAPLMNIEKINERLDSLQDLDYIANVRDMFRQQLAKLPDLERQVARIYQYSIKQEQKAVYFEDINTKRFKEFSVLLKNIQQAEKMIVSFQQHRNKFRSKRLKCLVSYCSQDQKYFYNQNEFYDNENSKLQDDSGMLPCIDERVTQLQNQLIWEGPNKDIACPAPGVYEEQSQWDDQCEQVKAKLKDYLKNIQKQFKDNTIEFAHTKHRYEIEIPERHVSGNKKPDHFEFSSQKKGFQRFVTQEIRDLVEELENAELGLKNCIKEFQRFLFKQFREQYQIWDRLIHIIAELDCLCSLSVVSFINDGEMSRPEIIQSDIPFMEIHGLRHPCLYMSGINVISNDVLIKQNQPLMLLTGPNMGGKSTTLRMVCIASILGQIGCYIPANKGKFSVVDRIFTRIGASDKLIEGKSTFFIEMEETLNIVKHGTNKSIAILDELGRGTSTFDGVAIAFSVLKYMIQEIKCRTIFATHYHVLIEEFSNYPEISFFHMAADVNEKQEKVIFLYKLIQGHCSQSFGINVAKVVGIEQSILQSATNQAKLFDEKMNFKRLNRINKNFNQIMNNLGSLENISQLTKLLA